MFKKLAEICKKKYSGDQLFKQKSIPLTPGAVVTPANLNWMFNF